MNIVRSAVLALTSALAGLSTDAATVALTNSDAFGFSSFNAALNWSNAQAPTGTNAYVVTNGYSLRTPTNFGNITFAGNSLALGDGTTLGVLTYKGNGSADIITISNLTLNSGQVGNGQGNTFTLAGDTTLGASGGIIDHGGSGRGVTLSAAVKGAGGLRVISTGSGVGTVTLAGTNTFNGPVTVVTGLLTLANSSALLNSSVAVSNNSKLRLSGNITITGRTATITGLGYDALGALSSAGGTNTWTGPVTLASDQTRIGAQLNCALVVNGAIDSGGSVFGPAIRGEDTTATVVLGGASTYSGKTAVVVGRLALGTADNRLPIGTTLEIGNTANTGGAVFDLAGFNQQIGGLTDLGTNMLRLVTNSAVALSTLTINGTGTFTSAAALAGPLALVKEGAGRQNLATASNSYSGGTTINGGILSLGANANENVAGLGSGTVTVNAGGQLMLAPGSSGSHFFIPNNVVLNGGAIWNEDGLQHLATNATLVVTPNGGTLTVKHDVKSLYVDALVSGSGPLAVNQANNNTTGVRFSHPSNTYSGTITVNGSNVRLDHDRALSYATVNVLVNTGLQFNAGVTNPLIGGLSGSGGLVLTGVTMTVGNNNSTTTYGGVLSGPGRLAKTGTGVLTLGAINTLSGGVDINEGTLALAASGGFATSTVSIGANGILDVTAYGVFTPPAGAPIQGHGLVTGSVSIADAAPALEPGTAGTPGTLTFANDLVLNAGYTNFFDLTNSLTIGGGVNDLLVINGDFEPLGAAIGIRPMAPLVSGTYRLINYGTMFLPSFNPAIMGATSRDTWTLDAGTPGQVNLLVAAGTNQSLVWSPITSDAWDIGTSTNWFNTGSSLPDAYYDADRVLFDDSGAATNVVALNAVVRPRSVTVNASSNYTITGAGGIADGFGFNAPLVKDGGGSLTLGTVNSFSGGTTVSNGAVVIATNGAMGSGPVALSSGALLVDVAGGTLANAVGGAGRLIKSGGGILTLGGANTYAGTTTISNGSLVVAGPGVLGGGAYAAGIHNDGALGFYGATQTLSGTVSGTGSLTQAGAVNNGALTLAGTNSFTGLTTVSAGLLALASTNGPALVGPVVLDNNLSPDLFTMADNQFGPGVVVTFTNNTGDHGRFELLGTTQTLAGIHMTYVNQKGIIQVREVGPAGLTNALLVLNGAGNYFYNGYLRDSAAIGSNKLSLTKSGPGTQTLAGTVIDYSGPTVVGAGSLVLTNVDDLWSAGSLVISNGANLVVDTSARTFQYKGKTTISGGGTITKLSSANLMMLGNNGNGVTMAMDPGALIDLRAGVSRNEYGPFNNWTNNKASMSVSNGAVFYIWDANTYVDALNGSGIIDANYNGYTLTVGSGDGSGTFDGVLRNSTGTLNLAKAGLGTQTLGGINTYTGTTTVAAGRLALGAGGSIAGTTRILVSTGATFDVSIPGAFALAGPQSLEGGGLVTGSVSTAAGSRIVPGTAGIAGTLTFGNDLGLHAATTNLFDLAAVDTTIGTGINDLIIIGGDLAPSNAVVAINPPAQPISNGTYRLVNYAGAKTGSFNPAVAGNTTHKSWTLDEGTAGQIDLVVGGSYFDLKWNSQVSSNWDLNVGANWLNLAGATNTTFRDADTVLFDDSGAVTNNIGIVGTLKPAGVTVNSSSNYSFTGTGRISGLTGLTKDGTGTLSLVGTTNDFTGPVTISGGTVSVGSEVGLGALPVSYSAAQIVLNGGTLKSVSNLTVSANRGITLGVLGGTLDSASSGTNVQNVFNSVIAGNGPLALNANGNLTDTGGGSGANLHLGQTNSFAGAVSIHNGVVSFAGDGAFGHATNAITLHGGGLVATINRTLDRAIVLAGGGDRIFRTYGNSTFLVNGNITGSGNVRRTDSGTNIFSGNLTHTGGFINGAATTWLPGSNTYSGGTFVNAGTLIVNAISDGGLSGIGHGALLSFGGGTLRYDGAAVTDTARAITNTGTGRVTLDLTNALGSLSLNGPIFGAGGLTKLGAGTLIISNGTVTSFQYNPGLTVRGGTLLVAAGQINSQNPANNNDYVAQAAGDVATMTLAGSSSFNRSNNTLYVADQPGSKGTFNIQDNARFWGNYRAGIAQNTGTTGTVVQTGGAFHLGNDNYVGNSGVGSYYHLGGTYTNGGGYLYLGVNGNAVGRFYQFAGPVYCAANLVVGHNGGANGAFYHTNGSVAVAGELGVGNNGAGSYGFYQLTGGSLSGGNWQQAARNGLGLIHLTGGTNTITSASQGIVVGNVGTGVVYIAGSRVNNAGRLGIGWSGTTRGEATIAGDSEVLIGNSGVQFNQSGSTFAQLNLNGGVLIASNLYKQVAGGYSVLNFNGGTYRALASQTVLGAGAGGVGALDAAFVYGGGAILDASNFTVTVAQSLRAPTGNGVTNIPFAGPVAGYIGAPYVSITGGGGTGATAVALFDLAGGSVTGIVLTCAGVDYTGEPTVTLIDGGTTNLVLGTAGIGPNAGGGLTKLGGGALLLTASNTYPGATLVSAGSLFGTGSVNGAVTVLGGAAIGPAYGSSLTGTFTVASSLTLSNGGAVYAYLRGTNPTLRVGGDFNIAPTTLVQLVAASISATGTHVLVDYDGTFNGSISDFASIGLPSGCYLTNNLANKSIDLVVTNVGGGIRWDGLVDATWRHAGPLNWKSLLDDSPAAYSPLDIVVFDDAATANFTVDVTEAVSPASVAVSNTNQDFTLAGGGGINGAGALTKSGTGALTLSTANGYTGGTVVNGGTLRLANAAALGAAGQPLSLNGGVVQLANDASVNAYNTTVRSGATLVSDRATPGAGLTHTLGTLMVTNNTTLAVTNGASVTGGPAGVTFGGRADFVNGGRLDVGTLTVLNLAGTASSAPVSSGLLTKNGEGTLIISSGNSYWDFTTFVFNSGTTIVRNANAVNDSATPITLGTNATFQFGLDGTINNHGNVTLNGDATLLLDRATPGAGIAQNSSTLTFASNYTLTVASGTNITSGTAGISFFGATLGDHAVVNVVNPTGAVLTVVTVTGNVTQAGTGRSLTKNGSGTLTLRPPNPSTYSGGTVVNGGTLVLSFGNASNNYGTIAGPLTINAGATVRSTVDKAFGFASAASGNVTTITITGGLLDHTSGSGHGGGQTVYLTAGEIRSNGGTPATNSGSFRFSGSGADPAIYVLASASTSLLSGRVALDTTGKFDVQEGAADADLLVTATLTDGIGSGSPPNGIIKTNAGTMVLNSSNFYSGITRVDGGRLLVNNGTGSGTGTNTVLVAAGATLGGTGSVAGTVTSDGTVAPGASAGRLTVGGGYVQNAGAALAIEIGGALAAGADYDQLTVAGTATLDGTLSVTLLNAYAPTTNDVFVIVNAGTRGGTFATTNLPALGGGNVWNVQYGAGTVTLTVSNTGTPPPSGYDLFALQITNGLTGYQQDADGDGYANLLEYVTGGDPTNGDQVARMNGGRTNGTLALRFTRNTNSVDATLIVEGGFAASNNAVWIGLATNSSGTWGGATNVVESGGGSPVDVTAFDTEAGATNRFLRLRATRP